MSTTYKSTTYKVTLTGETPLLMHHDNIAWAETMRQWGLDPANKAKSVAGDDRTPAHRWLGSLYRENDVVVLPSDNLMTMLREGGARCPTGKRGATFKRQTQSGLVVDQAGWPLVVKGSALSWPALRELIEVDDFTRHEAVAASMGFALFVKRARVGTSKHIRVRPRFDRWQASGTITVFDETITLEVLQLILSYAGRYAGIGDWRPSSPKSPGPYGTFTAVAQHA